jgi:hypothetical protein
MTASTPWRPAALEMALAETEPVIGMSVAADNRKNRRWRKLMAA